jgi:hypothetical protein
MPRKEKPDQPSPNGGADHFDSQPNAELSVVRTRRQFGKSAALGIAGLGLIGTQCGRRIDPRPPQGGLPGACADPIDKNHDLLVKIVEHDGQMFYELPRGAGKVCKRNAGAEPIKMRLSEDSAVDSVFVKLRNERQDLGSVFLRHPGNAGFEMRKGQPVTLVLKPKLGIKKRPEESRCTFCTESTEFARLVLLSYHTSQDGDALEHPHSQSDTDWHIEC